MEKWQVSSRWPVFSIGFHVLVIILGGKKVRTLQRSGGRERGEAQANRWEAGGLGMDESLPEAATRTPRALGKPAAI